MARSLYALDLPLELHSSDARCQSAATHPTDRFLRLQTFLQACRAKDVSAGHLHRLLEYFQAHGTRKAAEGVRLGRRLRRLRGSISGLRLRRRHLAAEERRAGDLGRLELTSRHVES